MIFANLSNRLSCLMSNISNRGRLTEDNIEKTLREVRIALLEADVALPVVHNLIKKIKENALCQEINKSFTPGQTFIKIVHTELVKTMGEKNNTLNLSVQTPAVVLIIGLHGVGKTTMIGKLSKYLRERQNKKVLVVTSDVYRPAAIKQLEILAKNVDVDFFPSNVYQQPIDIVNQALKQAKLKCYDVLLVDTAGRLHIDKAMMAEMTDIYATIKPIETLFIVDAMMGQEAVNIATIFNQTVPLTGIILTKVDSDTRGGVALSICHITGQPIKFIGNGENADALETFYPDRLARRILGMGDVLSLIENIEQKVHHIQVEKLACKLKQSSFFDITDFLEHLKQMRKVGGMANIISKFPGVSQLPDNVKSQISDKVFINMEAIINSMTAKERMDIKLIRGSRKRRIASGSGMQIQDVNRLLKQFHSMQHMVKKMKGAIYKK